VLPADDTKENIGNVKARFATAGRMGKVSWG
jgi:hypothetical protein